MIPIKPGTARRLGIRRPPQLVVTFDIDASPALKAIEMFRTLRASQPVEFTRRYLA